MNIGISRKSGAIDGNDHTITVSDGSHSLIPNVSITIDLNGNSVELKDVSKEFLQDLKDICEKTLKVSCLF